MNVLLKRFNYCKLNQLPSSITERSFHHRVHAITVQVNGRAKKTITITSTG